MSLRKTLLLGGVFAASCARYNAELPPRVEPIAVAVTAPRGNASVRQANAVDSLAAFDSLAQLAIESRSIGSAAGDATALVVDTAAAADGANDTPVAAFASLPLEPYASHTRVDYYVRLFTGTARARMGERLSRGSRYYALIRDKLRAGGIPEEFYYLALIESGYDPHAYSTAAAVGMWQFMASTARKAGLRVDWWVDERRDPVRATDAAIRFLTELNSQFGSMYLAAAAYNGGAGRVSRGLSSLARQLDGTEPDDQFFRLASTNLLRAETRNYVPQLIAAALIGREPATYGITVDSQPPIAFDSVAPAPATGLHAIATACATDLEGIRDLNGQLIRGMTPPDGATVWVRVPTGCAAVFDSAFAVLDDSVRRGAISYASKKGETPTQIAKRNGISLTVLRRYNPKVKTAGGSVLSTGTKLLIPSRSTLAAARDVPDPSIERWGGGGGGYAVNNVYVVRRGDTLGGIAERHGTSVTALKRVNKLATDRIVAGQRLRIKG